MPGRHSTKPTPPACSPHPRRGPPLQPPRFGAGAQTFTARSQPIKVLISAVPRQAAPRTFLNEFVAKYRAGRFRGVFAPARLISVHTSPGAAGPHIAVRMGKPGKAPARPETAHTLLARTARNDDEVPRAPTTATSSYDHPSWNFAPIVNRRGPPLAIPAWVVSKDVAQPAHAWPIPGLGRSAGRTKVSFLPRNGAATPLCISSARSSNRSRGWKMGPACRTAARRRRARNVHGRQPWPSTFDNVCGALQSCPAAVP